MKQKGFRVAGGGGHRTRLSHPAPQENSFHAPDFEQIKLDIGSVSRTVNRKVSVPWQGIQPRTRIQDLIQTGPGKK